MAGGCRGHRSFPRSLLKKASSGLCVAAECPLRGLWSGPSALRSSPLPVASAVWDTATIEPDPLRACRVGLAAWSGGQRPGAVAAGQPPPHPVAHVQRGGAALEPGVGFGGAAVAELEPASPPGG